MSYGGRLLEYISPGWRSIPARILKGEKPADLPVTAADQVRAGHQPQDRQGARPRDSADAARPRRRGDRMKRREFITLLGGAAAAWPLAARAQQPERMRRIGVLMNLCRGRSGSAGPHRGVPAGAAAIGLDRRPQCADRYRWAAGNPERHSQIRGRIGRARAGRHPWPLAAQPWRRCCRRPAPCRSCSCSRPIRSAPALSRAWRGRAAMSPALCQFEYGLSGKWLELLKQIAPARDASGGPSESAEPAGIGQFGAIQAVAPSLGVELSAGRCARRRRDRARRRGIRARAANGGLIVTASLGA